MFGVNKETVEKMIAKAVSDQNQQIYRYYQPKENQLWEIGKRKWLGGPEELICRIKKPYESYNGMVMDAKYNQPIPEYHDHVVEVPLETLLKNILHHCGIEISITPKKEASWEIVRKK